MKKITALFALSGKELLLPRFLIAFVFVQSLIILFVSGCVSAPPEEIFEVRWKPLGKAPQGVYLLFTSDRRRVVGCCAANRFFGPVSFGNNGKMEVGMLGATRMATPDFRYEQNFLDDLQAARSWHLEKNNVLVLKDIDGNICMKLVAEKKK